ncbi:2-dehydro-3-deoxygluconokinase [Clostridium thermobutyricum DSM 4928]|uniref:2-dehydro-3-deoxygluconokinase n=2 Tax=Clostridium thermobutyricum TaxID=29372 RepID=A0A1V4SUZ1_9CLOT|nr:sugar kinase [Clostridium thermobutyricum]OPX47737.1 2-dehydro-3-deoxygluconokinase [Clostridium thermobutyricum DSM 4928]
MKNFKMSGKKILGFGEIMLRLTPPNNQKIIQANSFDAVYSGGEGNVIASLAMFGHDTKFVTKLPENYLGDRVLNKFRGYNVDVNDVILGEGRLGIYYSEIGHGFRSTEVIYDRKYSAISMAKKEEFDIEKMLDSVGLIHLSGITPALSNELYEFLLELIKECKKRGILISYDSNYRAKLWTIEEARGFLEKILPYVDFAFLGYLDMINILKFEDIEDKFDKKLESLYKKLFFKYPNLKYAACTTRKVNSINNNTLKGYLFNGENLINSNEYTFDILDRVGGGDAFTAGILNGILKGIDERRTVEFGTCASVLKHSIIGDVNLVNEETINSLIDSGLCNIKR